MSTREHVGVDWSKLRETRPRDAVIRFSFGALVSLGAALVGTRFGPLAGGLFLAFPAILPAALTLIEENESRRQARNDCRGAAAGVPGLAVFALVVGTAPDRPALSLTLATVAWLLTSLACYLVWRRVREALDLDDEPRPTGGADDGGRPPGPRSPQVADLGQMLQPERRRSAENTP